MFGTAFKLGHLADISSNVTTDMQLDMHAY